MDRHHGTGPIVLASQDALGLRDLDLLFEPVEARGQVGQDVLARRRPLGEDRQVGLLCPQGLGQVDVILEAAPALQDAPGLGLILPEVRLGDEGFEARGLVARLPGLKGTSAVPPIAR